MAPTLEKKGKKHTHNQYHLKTIFPKQKKKEKKRLFPSSKIIHTEAEVHDASVFGGQLLESVMGHPICQGEQVAEDGPWFGSGWESGVALLREGSEVDRHQQRS
jgi:hypothetical protein